MKKNRSNMNSLQKFKMRGSSVGYAVKASLLQADIVVMYACPKRSRLRVGIHKGKPWMRFAE